MSVRTYNPNVRVGNWNEDIQLEEDTLKNFLERKEKGELLIQKSASLFNSVLKEAALSISRDGLVHYGDKVMLVNPGSAPCALESFSACAVSLNINNSPSQEIGVLGSTNIKPCARNIFVISPTSESRKCNGEELCYGEPFYLCVGEGDDKYYLSSDCATFMKASKKARNNEITLVGQPSKENKTEFKILYFDPRLRMEYDDTPVPANEKLIINHKNTNQNVNVENKFKLPTPFGLEYEISCCARYDSHRAEEASNHFILKMERPGDADFSAPQQ